MYNILWQLNLHKNSIELTHLYGFLIDGRLFN